MSDASNWWKPENLEKDEQEYLNKEASEVDAKNDFGSYKLMLKYNDFEKSKIISHNDLNPEFRLKYIKKILESNFSPKKILDVGCGLGFCTNEIKKFYDYSDVLGIDVSKDAIQYASEYFKDCRFLNLTVDPNVSNLEKDFDLIFTFEFYPFTRTNDISEHKRYIMHLVNCLSENGKLIIIQKWNNPKSLSVNITKLKVELNLNFFEYFLPYKKIFSLLNFFKISVFFSKIISVLLKKDYNKLLIIQK